MNVHLALLRKLHCRFLDQSTGEPVPGIIASLSVAVDDAPTSRLPVATLCADATGYMSFDLKPLIDLGFATTSVFLYPHRNLASQITTCSAHSLRRLATEQKTEMQMLAAPDHRLSVAQPLITVH